MSNINNLSIRHSRSYELGVDLQNGDNKLSSLDQPPRTAHLYPTKRIREPEYIAQSMAIYMTSDETTDLIAVHYVLWLTHEKTLFAGGCVQGEMYGNMCSYPTRIHHEIDGRMGTNTANELRFVGSWRQLLRLWRCGDTSAPPSDIVPWSGC